jgi:hypothetical protein
MPQLRTLIGLAVVLGGAVMVACNENVGPGAPAEAEFTDCGLS